MALTITVGGRNIEGNQRRTWGTLSFDTSYPTGGESYINANFELFAIEQLTLSPRLGYDFDVDYSGKKILAYYSDYNNASDGALIEVPNETDLSAVTSVRWQAIGV